MSKQKKWKIPILIAYPSAGKTLLQTIRDHESQFKTVMDSGAFTAYTHNRVIKVEDYMEFLNDDPCKLDFYFNLDIIGDPEGSIKNYEIMKDNGFDPVPVFTRGDTKETFDYYHKQRGFVGIGGIAGTKSAAPYLKKINGTIIQGRPVHWLGFSNRNFLLHYKPTSCDSTNWCSMGRFGRGFVYHNKNFHPFTRENFNCYAVRKFCDRYQIDFELLREDESWYKWSAETSIAQLIHTMSYLLFAREIEQRRNIITYLVCITKDHIILLKEAYKKILENDIYG